MTLFFMLNAVFYAKLQYTLYICKPILALSFSLIVFGHCFPLSSEIGQCYFSCFTRRFSFVKTFFFMLLVQSHRSQIFHRNNISSSHLCNSWLHNRCLSMRKSHLIQLHTRAIIFHSRATVSVVCEGKGNVLV